MSATLTNINITYVDNELYLLAIPSNGLASIELFHYKSGYTDKMNVTIIPQHVLPSGSYTLVFVGINWGGPSGFTGTLTHSDNTSTPVNGPNVQTVGAVWNQAYPVTV